MKVRVERKHIEKGEEREPRACPIALAMQEIPFVCLPHVGAKDAEWFDAEDGVYRIGNLPEEAQNFARMFDGGVDVDPIEFELEAP